jgi:hypothetical protein
VNDDFLERERGSERERNEKRTKCNGIENVFSGEFWIFLLFLILYFNLIFVYMFLLGKVW